MWEGEECCNGPGCVTTGGRRHQTSVVQSRPGGKEGCRDTRSALSPQLTPQHVMAGGLSLLSHHQFSSEQYFYLRFFSLYSIPIPIPPHNNQHRTRKSTRIFGIGKFRYDVYNLLWKKSRAMHENYLFHEYRKYTMKYNE